MPREGDHHHGDGGGKFYVVEVVDVVHVDDIGDAGNVGNVDVECQLQQNFAASIFGEIFGPNFPPE